MEEISQRRASEGGKASGRGEHRAECRGAVVGGEGILTKAKGARGSQ